MLEHAGQVSRPEKVWGGRSGSLYCCTFLVWAFWTFALNGSIPYFLQGLTPPLTHSNAISNAYTACRKHVTVSPLHFNLGLLASPHQSGVSCNPMLVCLQPLPSLRWHSWCRNSTRLCPKKVVVPLASIVRFFHESRQYFRPNRNSRADTKTYWLALQKLI